MGLRSVAESPEKVTGRRRPLALWAKKARLAGIVIAIGIGLYLGLRWASGAPPSPEPALNSFLADGGGGAIEVRGVYAPAEYFRLTKRDPAKLGLNPARELIFFVVMDAHKHDEDLPNPTTWWDNAFLRVDGNDYSPSKKALIASSEHHQTVALAFQRRDERGTPLIEDKGVLGLVVPDIGDGANRRMEWRLPLVASTLPAGPRNSLPLSVTALLPVLAGMLVAFSPCLVHMTSYYLPLFSGVRGQGGASRKGSARMASVAALFAMGFAIPYTAAGVAAGYAGQFVKGSLLGSLSQPLTLMAGGVVFFFGLQVAGVFGQPFLVRLNLPGLVLGRSWAGYLTSGLLGLNLAVGCLGCVGGTLFASLLLYSGVAGSPLEGGLVLFLFGMAANAPFFLAALTLGRFQLKNPLPLSAARYARAASGAILIALALLILSGSESVLEDALIQALGIQS